MPELDLSSAASYAAPTLECDLVMKGGISSGIVYPRAVCRLATANRLRRIGGTSAGAMAAAAAAAAEFGRTHDGFVKLNRLPDELGTGLEALFQPSTETRPVFGLLTAWLEPGSSKARKLATGVVRLIAAAPLRFAAAAVLVALPVFAAWFVVDTADLGGVGWLLLISGSVLGVLSAVVGGVIVALLAVGLRTWRALPANGFGMVNGHAAGGAPGVRPLTDWLYAKIQDLAGLGPGSAPLTLGDLWGPDAVTRLTSLRDRVSRGSRVLPEEWEAAIAARVIDLEVMTTNLTLGRPYRLPFIERIFYFCEQRLRDYFPEPVVSLMVHRSVLAEDKPDGAGGAIISMRCPCHGATVRSFPEPPDLPLVVAARLSLSFPLLLSAVPLFCIDFARGPGHRRLIEVWFSDGGISSNFPMHLFDSPLPSRPTYGFNLGPTHPDYEGLVWKPPTQGASGRLPRSLEVRTVDQFLRAVLNVLQNWTDNTRITMPGHRDRVVVIRQKRGEGGMNLSMEKQVIKDLADRGGEAAALFDDFDLNLHRWVRYRTASAATDELLTRMRLRHDAGFDAFVAAYAPTATQFKGGAKDLTATRELMKAARYLADNDHPNTVGTVPRPEPELRVEPRT